MNLAITLDSAAVEPGGTISGRVAWHGSGVSLDVTLSWTTRGKGDKDTDEVTSRTIPISGQTEARFELRAPYQPFTFSGKLISVVYHVTASISGVAGVAGSGHTTKTEIVIGPDAKEVVLAST